MIDTGQVLPQAQASQAYEHKQGGQTLGTMVLQVVSELPLG
jgi:hypothetical protein